MLKIMLYNFLFPEEGEENINITIDRNSMNQVTSTKFWGVYIDQHLTWVDHIKILANKIAKISA